MKFTKHNVVIFGIIFLLLQSLFLIPYQPQIIIDLTTDTDGNSLTVFYDNNQEGYPFDDDNYSKDYSLKLDIKQKIKIPYEEDFNYIRFDFGIIPAEFRIQNISFQSTRFQQSSFSAEELHQIFTMHNDIARFEYINGELKLVTSGTDGHIYNQTPIKQEFSVNYVSLFLWEIAFVAVALFFVSLSKILGYAQKVSACKEKLLIIGFLIAIMLPILFASLVKYDIQSMKHIDVSDITTEYPSEYRWDINSVEYDSNGMLEITGFCVKRGEDYYSNAVSVLSDQNNNYYKITTKSTTRPDVTAYFNDGNNYNSAGIYSITRVHNLNRLYVLHLLVTDKDGTQYLINTGTTIQYRRNDKITSVSFYHLQLLKQLRFVPSMARC